MESLPVLSAAALLLAPDTGFENQRLGGQSSLRVRFQLCAAAYLTPARPRRPPPGTVPVDSCPMGPGPPRPACPWSGTPPPPARVPCQQTATQRRGSCRGRRRGWRLLVRRVARPSEQNSLADAVSSPGFKFCGGWAGLPGLGFSPPFRTAPRGPRKMATSSADGLPPARPPRTRSCGGGRPGHSGVSGPSHAAHGSPSTQDAALLLLPLLQHGEARELRADGGRGIRAPPCCLTLNSRLCMSSDTERSYQRVLV